MEVVEAATLALAWLTGWAIASNEVKALRRQVLARLGQGNILTTPGICVGRHKGRPALRGRAGPRQSETRSSAVHNELPELTRATLAAHASSKPITTERGWGIVRHMTYLTGLSALGR